MCGPFPHIVLLAYWQRLQPKVLSVSSFWGGGGTCRPNVRVQEPSEWCLSEASQLILVTDSSRWKTQTKTLLSTSKCIHTQRHSVVDAVNTSSLVTWLPGKGVFLAQNNVVCGLRCWMDGRSHIRDGASLQSRIYLNT